MYGELKMLDREVSSFNPFAPNVPFFYLLKTSENCKFFLMFSGGRERAHWERMG